MDNKLDSLAAEQSLIAAIAQNPASYNDISGDVTSDDFAYPDNRAIFSAITRLSDNNKLIDAITILEECGSAGDKLFAYLTELIIADTPRNAKAYAKIVADYSTRRKILSASHEVAEYVLSDSNRPIADVIEYAQTALVGVDTANDRGLRHSTMKDGMKSYIAELQERLKSDNRLQGMSSGFDDIDEITRGYKQGHLIIIAGRPSMGKSTYALQKAAHMSINSKKNGLFFSLEMSVSEMMEKITACVGHVNLDYLQDPKSIKDDSVWSNINNAAPRVVGADLKIVDTGGLHINQLKSYARKAHRSKPLDFIFVDHIHIMTADGQSREREIANITGSLKALAVELQIPVFALGQLNRGLEQRTNKRPIMSDLRDSGSVEQDADMIQFIYRDDYYNDDQCNPNAGLIEIEIAKYRNGKLGKFVKGNQYAQSRLVDVDRFITYPDQQRKKRISGSDL